MSHHHKISTGPAITDRPTSAGKWEWRRVFSFKVHPIFQPHIFPTDTLIGEWHPVLITETPAAGRLCRELNMGGSIHCGLAPWSGQWRKAA
jgi:hypothetical protein